MAPHANATEKPPVAPCAFPFNASRKGTSITERFAVTHRRGYTFYLYIHHNADEKARELLKVLDAEYALFTTESVRAGKPVRLTSNDFMDATNFSSIHEKNEALTKANSKYWDAVQKAIGARLEKRDFQYLWLPQNLRGLTPIVLELTKIETDGRRIVLIERQSFDAIGLESANAYFQMPITGMLLEVGIYEIHVETSQDKPLFSNMPIQLGISFRAKV